MKKETYAYLWGLLGICGFGLTLPATKLAVPMFGVVAVGLGRAAIAGLLSLGLLVITKSKLPTHSQIIRLCIVASGVIFGFPLLSAYAMKYAPSSHGAIVIAILPLLTALFGVLLVREKPSIGYWIAGMIGSSTIILYSIYTDSKALHLADIALFLAATSAAIGYAEGAKLSRELGSWQVICYALVISLPITIPLSTLSVEFNSVPHPIAAWFGLLYISFISMFLAFFAWYKALSIGGIARIGQLQLLQPFVTIFASAILLSEPLTGSMFLVLAIVLFSVHFGRKSKIIRRQEVV